MVFAGSDPERLGPALAHLDAEEVIDATLCHI